MKKKYIKKAKIILLIILAVIICTVTYSFINKKKRILFIANTNIHNFFINISIRSISFDFFLTFTRPNYKKKFTYDNEISLRLEKPDSIPIDSDVQKTVKQFANNKNILRIISLAKKVNASFLITTEVKKIKHPQYEVIYYLVDLDHDYKIYEIQTKQEIDLVKANTLIDKLPKNYIENKEIQCQKIVHEISKIIYKRNSLFFFFKSRIDTELSDAFNKNNVEKIQALIKKGTNVNAINDFEETALHLAIRKGHTDIARLLIKKGADVNAGDMYEKTPLHYAVIYKNLDIAKVLIKEGADIEGTDDDHWTPLHYAARLGRYKIAKLLLEKGARVNAKTNVNATPVYFAAKHGHLKTVKILLENKADTNILTSVYGGPLHAAARSNYYKIAKILIENGADINAKGDSSLGSNPLHWAIASGSIKVAGLLLDNGADINSRDILGSTVLHTAVSTRNIKLVKLVLDNGADITSRNKAGATALHTAVSSENIKMVKFILDIKKININAQDKNKDTPLHWACGADHRRSNLDIAKLLVKKGANLKLKNRWKHTPFDEAKFHDDKKIINFLKKYY